MMRGLDVAFLGSGILQLFAVDATGTEEETKQAIEPIATVSGSQIRLHHWSSKEPCLVK